MIAVSGGGRLSLLPAMIRYQARGSFSSLFAILGSSSLPRSHRFLELNATRLVFWLADLPRHAIAQGMPRPSLQYRHPPFLTSIGESGKYCSESGKWRLSSHELKTVAPDSRCNIAQVQEGVQVHRDFATGSAEHRRQGSRICMRSHC